MATLKYRLNRKNSSGSYDTIHYETSSNIVLRPSGRTVEQDLEAYLPRTQSTDDVPQSLTPGLIVTTNNGTYVRYINGTVVKFLVNDRLDECGYNVTVLDNNKQAVKNAVVKCTTNDQSYVTDSVGKIQTTIYDTNKTLSFEWSSTFQNINDQGALYHDTTRTYKGSVSGTLGETIDVSINNTTVSTATEYYVKTNTSDGTILTIGSNEYIIVGTSNGTVYAILRYWTKDVVFDEGGSVTYSDSDMKQEVNNWYNSLPSTWRNSGVLRSINVSQITLPCFIPSWGHANNNGTFTYFTSNSRRQFTDSDGGTHGFWLSSKSSTITTNVNYVGTDGGIGDRSPTLTAGFRPAIAIYENKIKQ